MKKFIKLLNSKGAGLIQVLLGSTAIAAMGLIGIELSKNQKKLALKTSALYEMKYLEDELSFVLENKQNCWLNFKDIILSGNLDMEIESIQTRNEDKSLSKEVLIERLKTYSYGQKYYGQGNIYIKKYFISNHQKTQANRGRFNFNMELIFKEKDNSEQSFLKEVPISYKIEDNKLFGGCSSSFEQKSYTKNWNSNESDGVYFKNGMVGINVVRPESKVNIRGKLMLVGGDTLRCNSENQGTIRFAKSNNTFQICDNENWVGLGQTSQRFVRYVDYKYSLNSSLNSNKEKTYETSKHKICSITKVEKFQSNETCSLQRMESSSLSRFLVTMKSSGRGFKLSCEVWCYD